MKTKALSFYSILLFGISFVCLSIGSFLNNSPISVNASETSLILGNYNKETHSFNNATGTGDEKFKNLNLYLTQEISDDDDVILPSVSGYTADKSNLYSISVTLSEEKTLKQVAEDYISKIEFLLDKPQTVRFELSNEKVPEGLFYFSTTQHYYQFVDFPSPEGSIENKDWIYSYNQAKNSTFDGRTGYLATITSLEEDLFVYKASKGKTGWLGSARIVPTSAGGEGELYNDYSGIDQWYDQFNENWTWSCGPERNEEFYDIDKNDESDPTSTYLRNANKGYYFNWDCTGETPEPTNAMDDENALTTLCIHHGYQTHDILGDDVEFSWNDLPFYLAYDTASVPPQYTPVGFLVEYGNQKIGDSGTSTIFASEGLVDNIVIEIDGKTYSTLEKGIDDVQDNQTIKLLFNIGEGEIKISKEITFNIDNCGTYINKTEIKPGLGYKLTTTVEGNVTTYKIEKLPAAKIGNKVYAYLQEALDEVEDNETIVLLTDYGEEISYITEAKNFVIEASEFIFDDSLINPSSEIINIEKSSRDTKTYFSITKLTENFNVVYEEGEEAVYNCPIYTYYGDTVDSGAQYVIPASELTDYVGGKIESLTYYVGPDFSEYDISKPTYAGYLYEVDSETLDNFIDFDLATKVFEGHVSISSDCEVIIDFDNLYQYSGGNLAIAFICTQSFDWVQLPFNGIFKEGGSIYNYNYSDTAYVEIQDYIPTTGIKCIMPLHSVALINEEGYGSLCAAINAVTNNGTIELVDNIGEETIILSDEITFSIDNSLEYENSATILAAEGYKVDITTTDKITTYSVYSTTKYAAEIGTTKYTSLEDAISDVNDYGTIKLLKNVEESIEISEIKHFEIDANGFTNGATITGSTGFVVVSLEEEPGYTFYFVKKTVTFEQDYEFNQGNLITYGFDYDKTPPKIYDGDEELTNITLEATYYSSSDGQTWNVLTDAPSDAGQYKVVFSVPDSNASYVGSKEYLFSIGKATPTYTAPTAKSITYNGEAQILVDSGVSSDGTFLYSLTEDGGYTSQIPLGTNAGYYEVYWKLIGDDNHTDASGFVLVTIDKAKVSIPPEDPTEFTYNGNDQTYNIPDNDAYTVTGNVAKDAGTHTVIVTLNDPTNYEWSDGTTTNKTYNFVIGKAVPTYTAPTAKTITYNGEAQTLVNPGSTNDGTFVYSLTQDGEYTTTIPTGTNAGQYTIYWKLIGDNNHVDASGSVVVNIEKIKVTIPPADPTEFTYNGEEQEYYIPENDAYIVSGNIAVEPGEHTVTVSLRDPSNYEWADGTITDKTYTFVILEAPVINNCIIHWFALALLIVGTLLISLLGFAFKKYLAGFITSIICLITGIVLFAVGHCPLCIGFGIANVVVFTILTIVMLILYIKSKNDKDPDVNVTVPIKTTNSEQTKEPIKKEVKPVVHHVVKETPESATILTNPEVKVTNNVNVQKSKVLKLKASRRKSNKRK